MDEVGRVPCACCGAMILPATAQKTGGLCRPCKGGYREDISRAKANREQESDYRQTPFWRYWNSLVDRVNGSADGFEALSAAEKTFYAMRLLLGSVHQSGFYGYFDTMADHHAYAVDGLRQIGATKSLNLVVKAQKLLFGSADVSTDPAARAELLPDIDELETNHAALVHRLGSVEERFWSDPDDLYARTYDFGVQNGLYLSE